MWIQLDDAELALALEAVRGNCTDKPGDENDYDRLHDRITKAIANQEGTEAYRAAASDEWHEDGECEIDDDAIVSLGDDPGAYVMAWVWVTNEQAGISDEDEDEDCCDTCGEPLDDAGDGYDGKCADCADKAEAGE